MPCEHSVPINKTFEIGSVKVIWYIGSRCTKCQQLLPHQELKELYEMLEARGFDGDKFTKDDK